MKKFIVIEKLEDGHFIAADQVYTNTKVVCDDFYGLVKLLEKHFTEESVEAYRDEGE